MAVKIFKDKCIILNEIASKTVHNDKQGDWWQKNKYEVKAIENINKNPQSFLEINPT